MEIGDSGDVIGILDGGYVIGNDYLVFLMIILSL